VTPIRYKAVAISATDNVDYLYYNSVVNPMPRGGASRPLFSGCDAGAELFAPLQVLRQFDNISFIWRYNMTDNVQKQLMIKSLPPFPIDGTIVLKESNLNEVLRAAETLLPQHINEKIQIKIEIASRHLPVAADAIRMGEALVNLVQNGVEAMSDGGVLRLGTNLVASQDRPPYQTGCCASGACALISVTDTGIGMNSIIKQSMFEPYFTTKQGDHRGLGLPIAYSIIRKHNGCVKVESVPGKGTTIKVYLPLLKGAPREEDGLLLPRSFFGEVYGEYRRC
jgi:hypothetical protein